MQLTFPTGDLNWNTSDAASFVCDDYTFSYNTSVANHTAIFTINNVQSEPLFGLVKYANTSTFDPGTRNSTAPWRV